MPDKNLEVATRFAELVRKYENWNKVSVLSEQETRTMLDLLYAAGFEPRSVAPGRLVGHYLEQDGSRTGETYPINSLYPFKVVDQACEDDYMATGWLEGMARLVWSGATVPDLSKRIEQSVPMKPIRLTADGDMLSEYPPDGHVGYFVQHTRDDKQLSNCVGVHKFCHGWMDRVGATAEKDAIVCRRCHLRVLFPKTAKTYGDLRQALGSQ